MLNIKQRQMNLQFLNYYWGEIDGIEGNKTKGAYFDFQKEFKLNAIDGIYGNETDTKLIEVIKKIQIIVVTTVDGVAGNNTITKLKEWQKLNGLDSDGIAGIKTRTKMGINVLDWNGIKHFKKSEFTCKCGCGLNNINLDVVKVADEIREYFGSQAIVTSGTRCSLHNKKVGGVSNSRHLSGKAIDFYVKGVSGNTLLKKAKEYVNNGKLRYTYLITGSNAIHIDIK